MNKTAAFNLRTLSRGARRLYSGLGKQVSTRGSVLRRGAKAGVVFGGGAGAGVAGMKFAPKVRAYSAMKKRKKVAYYKNKSRTIIVWNTGPGLPVLEGRTSIMLNLFNVGKRDKKKGIVLLAQLLKSGQVRKVGTVPLTG
jgi:hypothetical protein